MLNPQTILRIAGIALLVVAVLFALLAVHYYLTQDIRGVMDDLSGKTRARGVARARRGEQGSARRASTRRSTSQTPAAPVRTAAPTQATEPEWKVATDDGGRPASVPVEVIAAPAARDAAPAPARKVATEGFVITRRIVLTGGPGLTTTGEEPLA